jgi:hypothetical protein
MANRVPFYGSPFIFLKARGMNTFFTLRRATLLLALALPSFCWGFGPPPKAALIVDDGTAFDVNTVETFLSGRLVAAGYTVTTNTGVPGTSLAAYKQVWDIRFQNNTPLTGSDVTAYMTYMTGGGSLFVMGENSSFLTRDNSIIPLITAAGGGNATISQTQNSSNSQTAQAPFTGPVTLSSITFAAIGAWVTFGNARQVTLDGAGLAGGIVFPPGSMTNVPLGTLIVMLDVNFLTAGLGSSQPLTDNLIAYLATPTPITPLPSGTPAPTTILLVLVGLGGAGLYAARRPWKAA